MKLKKLLSSLVLVGIISGCGEKLPPLTWCIIDGKNNSVECADPEGKSFSLTILQAHKYIAQSPRDAEVLRNFVLDLQKENARLKANCR